MNFWVVVLFLNLVFLPYADAFLACRDTYSNRYGNFDFSAIGQRTQLSEVQENQWIYLVRGDQHNIGPDKVGVFHIDRIDGTGRDRVITFSMVEGKISVEESVREVVVIRPNQPHGRNGSRNVGYFSLLASSASWVLPPRLAQGILLTGQKILAIEENPRVLIAKNQIEAEMGHMTSRLRGSELVEQTLGREDRPQVIEKIKKWQDGQVSFELQVGAKEYEFIPLIDKNMEAVRKTWLSWRLHQRLGLGVMVQHRWAKVFVDKDGYSGEYVGILRRKTVEDIGEAEFTRIQNGKPNAKEKALLTFEFLLGQVNTHLAFLGVLGGRLHARHHEDAFPAAFLPKDFTDSLSGDLANPVLGAMLPSRIRQEDVRNLSIKVKDFLAEYGGLLEMKEAQGLRNRALFLETLFEVEKPK